LCYIIAGPRLDQASAATATGTFTVTAAVAASCLISATDMSFGVYAGSLTNATSSISVTCTNTTPYNVGLDGGTAPGGHPNNRRMRGLGGSLAYSLFRNSARTLIWGQTIGSDTVSGTGNGNTQVLPVYGQIPAGQAVTPGGYLDTITATITY
jgi:spore coat protein U-like protein